MEKNIGLHQDLEKENNKLFIGEDPIKFWKKYSNRNTKHKVIELIDGGKLRSEDFYEGALKGVLCGSLSMMCGNFEPYQLYVSYCFKQSDSTRKRKTSSDKY